MEGVSVVVCAKNEYQNLVKLLPILMEQSYLKYEVIIVDDHSTDETNTLKSLFPSIKWIDCTSDLPGKKAALSQGIQSATYEWILLTDADCFPSLEWVKTMMDHSQGNDMVLGYSPMMKTSGWINYFSRYETLWTAIQYISYAKRGLPYMGVGRNLLYKKSLFLKAGGFKSHQNTTSGDDDLFVQSVLKYSKVGICIDLASWVETKSTTSIYGFLKQKARHTSTSLKYTTKHQMLLGIFSGSHMLWVVVLMMGINQFNGMVMSGALIVWLVMSVLHRNALLKLGGDHYSISFPFMDVFMGIYYWMISIFAPLYKLRKRNTWN